MGEVTGPEQADGPPTCRSGVWHYLRFFLIASAVYALLFGLATYAGLLSGSWLKVVSQSLLVAAGISLLAWFRSWPARK